jgi:hypothetical protein
MKTLRFSILVEAIDSYIYSGHLFLILKNGDIAFAPLSIIIRKLAQSYPSFENLIRLAFQRNDYLSNRQGLMILGVGDLKKAFVDLWERAADEMQFVIQFDPEDYTIISQVPTMPVLDMRLYAMRMYLGCKEGLYEIELKSDDRYNLKPTKPEKRFDAKVTCLNAKSGEVIISCNNDGLFHGTFLNVNEKLEVNKIPVAKKSIRTAWSSYDIINYEKQNDFEYLVNKTESANEKPAYSKFDENRERQKISTFGVAKYDLSDLLERSDIRQNDINYCFNSSASGFFFMKDGRFVNINLNKEKKEDIYFTSRTRVLPNLQKKDQLATRPISTSIVPNGCVVEYFDKVVLYQNSQAKVIETTPSINVRSYMSSIRYRNLISVTKIKEVSIHSIFPFDENAILTSFEDYNNNLII